MKSGRRVLLPLIFLGILLVLTPHAFASNTDGTVDATGRWAWSENAGWLDFGTTLGAVHVTDSALSGYAYGENVGWISLNCSNTSTCADNNYAVTNNGEGTLSGYAWSENTGWIDFAPSTGGVSINSSGVLSGNAYSENLGWIVFTTDHPVATDWRPASSRTTPSGASGGRRRSRTCRDGMVWSPTRLECAPVQTPVVAIPGSSPSSTSTPHFTFLLNRHIWDSGEDIRTLQKFLNTHGFSIAASGLGSSGNETSTFGPLTLKALKKFQASIGLPAFGYFGPLTRAFINTHY